MSFSADGNHYALYNKTPQVWTDKILKTVIKPLKSKYKKMLDMGCGTGEDTILMGEYFHVDDIIGVDKNESYINYARVNNSFNSRATYELCNVNNEKDVQEILEKNEDIDLVVSSFLLQFVDDPLNLFKIISRSIQSGTVEHVHSMILKLFEPMINVNTNIQNHPKWKNFLKDVNDIPKFMKKGEPNIHTGDFSQQLSKMNYEICTESVITMSYRFESKDEIIGLLRWSLPLTKYIPFDLQDEFLQDCFTEYTKDWNFDDHYLLNGDIYVVHMKHC